MSWTYALATPDCLLAGRLTWLIDLLDGRDLRAVAARLIAVDPERMRRVYASIPGLSLRPFALLYGLGPGCLLLVARDGPGAAEDLVQVKGATDPAHAAAGTVRAAGENVVLNLLHCPDDEAAARAELTHLLDDEAADWLALAGSRVDVRALTVDLLPRALPATGGPATVSVPRIVDAVRFRLVARLAVRAGRRPDLLAELTDAVADPGRLRAVADLLGLPRHAEALAALSAAVRGGPVVGAVRASGTYLSPTEAAVLEIHAGLPR